MAEVLIPYGLDYICKPWLVGLNIIFVGLMTLILIYFKEKTGDIPFTWICLLFCVFIITCSTTYILQTWELWHPRYDSLSWLKAVTVISLSLCPVVAIIWFLLKPFVNRKTVQKEAAKDEVKERKQIEERLQLLERAIASSSNGIVITDATQPDNPVIYVNPAFEQITGYTSAEIIGKNCRCLQGHETSQSALDELRKALQEERSCRVVLRNYRKDGSLFWNEFSVSPVRDASGNLTHYIGVQRDITEFKQAEDALQQSEVRFQKLTENVPGVIYQYCQYPNGTDAFTYVSPGIRELFELEPDSVLNSTELMWASIHPDDLSTFIASVKHSAHTGRQWCWEWRSIMPSGTVKWLRGVARPERKPDGTITWDGILLDISDDKEVEEALFQQEQQYRTLAENCPDIITRFNRELQYIYANPAFEQATGKPYQNFIGKTNQEAGMPPEMVERWNANIQACFDTAQARSDEFDFPTPTGWRSYQARLVPEYGKDGEVEFVLVVTRDITELKQTDAALQESEKRFRAIFEQAAVGIVQISLSGQFIQANQRFCDLVGYSESELLRLTCLEITHPSDQKLTSEYEHQLVLGHRQTYSIEKRYIHKQGQEQWVNLTVSLVRDAQGTPEYFIKVVEDISERKQAEAALRKSEQKFHAVFDSVLEGILIADDDGSIIEANPAACVLLSLSKEQIIGRPVLMFIEPEQAFKTYNDWQNFLAGGQIQGEFTLCLSDGTTKEVEYSAVANFLPTRHLSVFHDITERKRAEVALRAVSQQEREKAMLLEQALRELQHTQAQLVQNEKMVSLGQLVAGVAHEINNPTSFIYGNVQPASDYAQDLFHLIELYQQYYPKPVAEITEEIERIDLNFIGEDFPKLLASMRDGAERISQIVLSLRNFSRLDEMEKKRADIHDGIDNTLLIIQNRLKQQSHRPEIQVIKDYGELPLIECYPGQLNQVFMNLIGNAIDALDDGNGLWEIGDQEEITTFPIPTICIQTEVIEDNWVIIRIADNGPGITTEFQPKIFDPFFTTKPPGKGTGLGLSISYRIVVNKHGGKLTCDSVPGQGAEFAIALPITQSETSGAIHRCLSCSPLDKGG